MGPHPEDRGVRQPLSQPSWHGGGGKRGPSVVTMGRASRRAEEPRTAPSAPGNARTSLVLRRQPLVLRRGASSCAAEPRSAPSAPRPAPPSLVPRRRASFRAAEPRSAPSAPRPAPPSLVPRRGASFCAVSPSSCAAEPRSAQPSVVLRRQPLVLRSRASFRAAERRSAPSAPRPASPSLVPRHPSLVLRRGASHRLPGPRTNGASLVPPSRPSHQPLERTAPRPTLRWSSLPSATRPERNLYSWGANLPGGRSAHRPHLRAAPRTFTGIHHPRGELAAGRLRGPRRASTPSRRGRSIAAIAPSRTGNKSKRGPGTNRRAGCRISVIKWPPQDRIDQRGKSAPHSASR